MAQNQYKSFNSCDVITKLNSRTRYFSHWQVHIKLIWAGWCSGVSTSNVLFSRKMVQITIVAMLGRSFTNICVCCFSVFYWYCIQIPYKNRFIFVPQFNLACVLASPLASAFDIVSRNEWNARPAAEVNYINNKVSYVIIHHSYIPAACHTEPDCIEAVQSIQRYHQIDNQWLDIGYT